MNGESNSRLSRISEKISVTSIASANTSSSQDVDVEDVQTSTRSTVLPHHIVDLINAQKRIQFEQELPIVQTAASSRYSIFRWGNHYSASTDNEHNYFYQFQKRSSIVEHNEDDINLQYTSASMYKNSNNNDREPMFVIVDSNCESNPSSREMIINKKNVFMENSLKKYKCNVIPEDIPCTSRDQTNFMLPRQDGESREELEMVVINLQSENEINIDEDNNEIEPESIVIAYLRNKDAIVDSHGIVTAKKNSSILDNVPKMETIPEDKQFSSISGQLRIELSENSLDVHIPSYLASPRSLSIGPARSSESNPEEDPVFRKTIELIHQDREFLMAAEIGNDRLLEIYIRRGTNVQQIDYLGRNALHLAVCSNNIRAVQVLLDAGVDPKIKDKVGMTPLSLSLMRRPSFTVAQLLLDHGARLMPRSDPMDTGLFIQFVMMCIPTEEESRILKLLVEKGATVNDSHAPGGRQALHFAAMSDNTILIRLLVSLGADLYMKNHRNETPRDVAESFGCNAAYELLCELEEDESTVSSSNKLNEIIF